MPDPSASRSESKPARARRRASIWLAAVLGAIAATFVLDRSDPVDSAPAEDEGVGMEVVRLIDEPGALQHASSPQLRIVGVVNAPLALRPGDNVHVNVQQWPKRGSVRLRLDLIDPSLDGAPRPLRVYMGGELALETMTEPLIGDRRTAVVDVPARTIDSPGRYIVEIETTERSHFPVRRYAIEVH